ncbi:MAG TPA: saccharopine dehydrogenase C-terminal domain-containing protein [Vicinamibacterales bacterium]|jgi:saccharopine dehydrogenase-like NADP-dependent oxidoreductase
MTGARGLTIAVIGAGAMGRIVVKDLLETAPDGTLVVVCDVDRRRLREIATSRPKRTTRVRVKPMVVDARNVAATTRLLKSAGAFGVINAAQHHFNLAVMDAAHRARVHYCDLGGLFHVTRKQIVRDQAWKKIDRLAVLGIGAAPGIVNVLARSAADTMDEVSEIHISVGSVDAPAVTGPPIAVSYSIQTVIDEATQNAALFTEGKLTFVPPLSHAVQVDFPAPVGRKWPACTIHSELATLPRSYKSKRLRECSFRIAFADALLDRLIFMRAAGLFSERPIPVRGTPVTPRDVVLAALRAQPSPPPSRLEAEYEILRVVIRGTRGGQAIEETVDCHTPAKADWGIGSDINTGSPPSIVMQMLACGEITARGCQPPERAVTAEAFFKQLALRGMSIRRDVRTS